MRDELSLLLEFLVAAVLMEDVTILVDFVRWQDVVLSARGEPTMAAATLDSVSAALGDGSPWALLAVQAGERAVRR